MPRPKTDAVKPKAASAAKRPRGPKASKLPDPLPKGEILKDLRKKEWKLGDVIGQGGFGLIYLASENCLGAPNHNASYVVKIEPMANGPLFCELHFYQRVAKPETIESYRSRKKLKYVSVPKFIATGNHVHGGKQYRFLVMQRFGTDLQKIFEANGKKFPANVVFSIGLRMIDALEFIHENSYVHADIKASNLLLGFSEGAVQMNQVYLVDYGLALKHTVDGAHRAFKEDPKKAHDGTIEFTSTDAHRGTPPSRRGDMEILGFCMLQWLCGKLPWEDNLSDKNYVAQQKFRYMKDVRLLMRDCFKSQPIPDELVKFFEIIKSLKYDQRPDYDAVRQLFAQALKKNSWKDPWNLGLESLSSSPKKKGLKRKSTDALTDSSTPLKPKSSKPTPKKAGPSSSLSKSKAKMQANGHDAKLATPVEKKAKISLRTKSPSTPKRPASTSTSKSPVKKVIGEKNPTRRKVKRRKVVTKETSMQTSPP